MRFLLDFLTLYFVYFMNDQNKYEFLQSLLPCQVAQDPLPCVLCWFSPLATWQGRLAVSLQKRRFCVINQCSDRVWSTKHLSQQHSSSLMICMYSEISKPRTYLTVIAAAPVEHNQAKRGPRACQKGVQFPLPCLSV